MEMETTDVVKCDLCGAREYWAHMIWWEGGTRCRKCTYDRWELSGWKRSEKDLTFPDTLHTYLKVANGIPLTDEESREWLKKGGGK